jgi:hypothetical protein
MERNSERDLFPAPRTFSHFLCYISAMEFKTAHFEALKGLARQITANQIAVENILLGLHPSQQRLRDVIGAELRKADDHLRKHPEILKNNFPGLFD